MQNRPELTRQSPPRVFHYSLDWRFLLPLSNLENTFVFFEDDGEFSQTLEHIGIPSANHLTFLDIGQRETSGAATFILPFGVPLRWVGKDPEDQIEFFRSLKTAMGDFGSLLVGFKNSWNDRSTGPSEYYTSTPGQITARLQMAGFKTTTVFGVIPDLSIPEYIFELNNSPMTFALQHRFKRKPLVTTLLQLLSYTLGAQRLAMFMPCYFVIAIS
jgi:hypothetical protein